MLNLLGNKKKYYFLAGLPRSGNTVLSSVLNQNSILQVSANSSLINIIEFVESQKRNSDRIFFNFPDHKSMDACLSGIFDSYYKSWTGNYIIDRGPWGIDSGLSLLENYCPNADDLKFICPVRDLNQILASWLVHYHRTATIDLRYEDVVLDCIKNKLMRHGGMIYHALWSVKNLSQPKYKDRVYFMHYDNFCNNPQGELNNIYDFLGIKRYKHDFNNIGRFEANGVKYIDNVSSDLMGIYYVKPTVEKRNHPVDEVLPLEIRQQYKDFTVDNYKDLVFDFS